MFLNRFPWLYSFSSLKPAPLVPLCNTRCTPYFSTESKNELKPEDTFGDYSADVASCSHDYNGDDSKGSDLRISEAIIEIKKFMQTYEFDQAKQVFNDLKKTKKPPPYIYKLLFGFAARLGKAEEAFKLYNDFKKRGFYVDGAMFTSLFYACAKCPRSDVALPMANKIMWYLFNNKNHKPNSTNINSMLLAFSRHGDVSTVMQIIDNLEGEGRRLTITNMNIALDCCTKQRNTGLRFAILIWHHMLRKKIPPDSYTFTVLARCVRDCSLGDSDLCGKFIDSVVKNSDEEISQFQGPNRKELVHYIEEESKPFYGSSQRRGDVKESNSVFNNNNESEQSDSVLNAQNSQAEMKQSMGNVTLNTEIDERTQNFLDSIKAGSSNSSSLATENKEESQCTTRNNIAASEKDVTLFSENNKELIDLSTNAGGSQLSKIQLAEEFKSEEAAHQFDDKDLPNLLTRKPPGKSIINYGDFSTPGNRLMLFGGLTGFLETVKSYNVKPSIIMFSVLLDCIPSRQEDEEALMTEMKKFRIKVDTVFLNTLIRRRALRNKESTPEDFLELFKKFKSVPDVVTFGSIALSCVTHESGKKCIELARSHNIRLNNVILLTLLIHAGRIGDMAYVSDILKAAKEDDTELDVKFISHLKRIVEKEKRNRRRSISY